MLKAIDTKYAGHLFRSRLEARFAIFMDALKWEWDYEPEGFHLERSGFYLPDFHVTRTPGIDLPYPFWVEVKATAPSIGEINALRELACESGEIGFFFIGTNTRVPKPWQRHGQESARQTLKRLQEESIIDGVEYQLTSAPFRYVQIPTTVFSPATETAATLIKEAPAAIQEPWQLELDFGLQRCWREMGRNPYPAAAKKALSARF